MPFNYNQNFNAIQADPRIIEGASKSSFDIAGKAMTQLNDAIDNRAFERDISSAKDLQGLSGLTPTTAKQQALFATKQGMFNALAQDEQRSRMFNLQQAAEANRSAQADNMFQLNAAKAQLDSEQNDATNKYRKQMFGLEIDKMSMPSLQKGDVIANQDGTFSRVLFDTKSDKTSLIPSSEAEYMQGLSGTAGKNKPTPHTMQNGQTMMMTADEARSFGALPYNADIELNKEALTPESRKAIGTAIADYETNPDVVADKWIKDMEVTQDADNTVFDQEFNFKQKKMYKSAIAEVMKSPEYRKNFVKMNNNEKFNELNELLGITPKDSGSYAIPSIFGGALFPDRILAPSEEVSKDKAFFNRFNLENK